MITLCACSLVMPIAGLADRLRPAVLAIVLLPWLPPQDSLFLVAVVLLVFAPVASCPKTGSDDRLRRAGEVIDGQPRYTASRDLDSHPRPCPAHRLATT